MAVIHPYAGTEIVAIDITRRRPLTNTEKFFGYKILGENNK
jgi:hypothetical protein